MKPAQLTVPSPRRRMLPIAGLLIILVACAPAQIRPLPQARHTQTRWNVQASLPLDALAFINALTGDPLVGAHYHREQSRFSLEGHPAAAEAAGRLAKFRSDSLGSNLSGFLYPWFSAGKPQDLADLAGLCDEPESMRQALVDYDQSNVEMNVYYNDEAWKLLQQALPDVCVLLAFLQEQGFEDYWLEVLRPTLEDDLARVQAEVEAYNIVPKIEAVLGFGLPSDEVTVSLVYFEWPYGHHILGTHFATIPADQGVLNSTIHELLHHPFNNTDPAFWKAANSLKDDPLIWGAFEGRDTRYGYNDWAYYVAEDSVRALEQVIEVRLGLGERWTWQEDGGMHQLAAALYATLKNQGFPQNGESYQQFFIRVVESGELSRTAKQRGEP